MPVEPYLPGSDDFVLRLKRVLIDTRIACACRVDLEHVLTRFQAFEFRRALRFARRERDQIATQLAFLAELDRVSESEDDHSVYEEMAVLFDEIERAACDAAKAIRSAHRPSPCAWEAGTVRRLDLPR